MNRTNMIKTAIAAVALLALVANIAAFCGGESPDQEDSEIDRDALWNGFEVAPDGRDEMEADRERDKGNGANGGKNGQGGGNNRGDSRVNETRAMNDDGFGISILPQGVVDRITGVSYPEGAEIELGDLRYLSVLHIGFDGKVHHGELIVNRIVAEEVLDIFRELYEKKFPIAKIRLIDDYGANDQASMADNNTSAFCWREIAGGGSLSAHSMGLAIDINPLVNPYVKEDENGSITVLPPEGKQYVERDGSIAGLIVKGDACYEAFAARGWEWGGDWLTMKDYQHFSKPLADGSL